MRTIVRNGLIILLVFTVLLFFVKSVSAEVIINEFSSNTSDDWVELYNKGDSTVNLGNLRLRDTSQNNKKDVDGDLDAKQFVAVDFSNYLNKDGDTIKLIRLDGDHEEVVDEITYGSGGICTPDDDQSIGRKPDGEGNITRFKSQSRGSSNDQEEKACDPPSPTPELSATPSPTPKPTPFPTPTPKPTPKALPKQTSPSPESNDITDTTSDSMSSVAPLASAEVLSASDSAQPRNWGGLLIVLGGVICSGAGGYFVYKKQNAV